MSFKHKSTLLEWREREERERRGEYIYRERERERRKERRERERRKERRERERQYLNDLVFGIRCFKSLVARKRVLHMEYPVC